MTVHAAPAIPISEKQFMGMVVDLAKILGWESYHPWLSIYSARGWPDLAMVRPPRLILAELKTEKGTPSPAQSHWLGLLGECPGVETFLWKPSDFDEIARVLR